MIFTQTSLPGAYMNEPERHVDERGFFARIWCAKELEERGLKSRLLQSNVGFNYRKGTLRGLHFQKSPAAEVKIVRCTRGAVFDVIVDLRPDSASYREWFAVELSFEKRNMIYVPEGFAQGYMTLEDDSEIYYHTSEYFAPDAVCGVRYDDPAFGIKWPLAATVVSTQDRHWPLLEGREVCTL